MRVGALRGVVGFAVMSGIVLVASPASVHADPAVQVHAVVGGKALSNADANRPVPLRSGSVVDVRAEVVNGSTHPIDIEVARVEGRVMGLTFFAFQNDVSHSVAPGQTLTLEYKMRLLGIKSQAVGLIPGRLELVDANNHVIAAQPFTADVRGTLGSVYGIFGLAVILFTAMSLTGAIIALRRGRLPAVRARRGLRFMIPGIGIALTITFSLSALRIVTPGPSLWLPLLIAGIVIGFLVGYLTPDPEGLDESNDGDAEADDDGEEGDTVDLVAAEAHASGVTTTDDRTAFQ